MSLLTQCQDASVELGLAEPNAIVGSQDANAKILLRLARSEGYELARRHDWQGMTFSHSFTSTASEIQADGLPEDYDRLIYDVQMWDRTRNQRLSGPTDSNSWMLLKSGVTAGVHGAWRLMGGRLLIYPAPPENVTYEFEYVSKGWVTTESGEPRQSYSFEADDDTTVFPEGLLKTGIIWRYRKAKGFDYSEEMKTHELWVDKACSRDRGVVATKKAPKGATSSLALPTWPGRIVT